MIAMCRILAERPMHVAVMTEEADKETETSPFFVRIFHVRRQE